ncbi:hypothetical protein AWJ19_12995 [Paenibacillus sp. DMB5]|nr:hypothetical protein AWJ19_12995 [Paenibacillus sp. DMB5]
MLLRAALLGEAPLACRLAALLQERDLFKGPADQGSDITLRVEALALLLSAPAQAGARTRRLCARCSARARVFWRS